jgi:hypothetical protein
MSKQGNEQMRNFWDRAKNTTGLVVATGVLFPIAVGGALVHRAAEASSGLMRQVGEGLAGMVKKRK